MRPGAFSLHAASSSRPRPPFAHGAVSRPAGPSVIASYHPSRQNTNTGKLTPPMLASVFQTARQTVGTDRKSVRLRASNVASSALSQSPQCPTASDEAGFLLRPAQEGPMRNLVPLLADCRRDSSRCRLLSRGRHTSTGFRRWRNGCDGTRASTREPAWLRAGGSRLQRVRPAQGERSPRMNREAKTS